MALHSTPSPTLIPPFPVLTLPSHHSLSSLPLKCLSSSPWLLGLGPQPLLSGLTQVCRESLGSNFDPHFAFSKLSVRLLPLHKDIVEFLGQALGPVPLHGPQVPDSRFWLIALFTPIPAVLEHSHSRQSSQRNVRQPDHIDALHACSEKSYSTDHQGPHLLLSSSVRCQVPKWEWLM